MSSSASTSRNRRLVEYGRRYLSWYLGGSLLLVVTNVAGLAIPAQVGDAVQALRDAAPLATVVQTAQVIIMLAVVAGLARVASRIAIFNAGRFVEYDIRNEIYAKLTSLEPAFFGAMPTGDLTSRAANDVAFVRTLFAIPVLHIVSAGLAYGIALRKMVAIDLTLTFYCLLPYPLLLVAFRRILIAMFAQTIAVQEHLSRISSRAQENLSGVALVKAYVLESRESHEFGELSRTYVDENMRLAVLRGQMQAVIALIAGLGTLIVLGFGASRVVEGTLSIGKFVEFNGYVAALAFPTIAMGWVFSVWHRGVAAFDRIREILDATPAVPDVPSDAPTAQATEGARIELDRVSFAYGDGPPVLDEVSLTIEPGQTVAIVGRTGAGKTTLLSLLSRFADPTTGEIRLDGTPLRDLPLRATRAEFGVVPQGPFLFSMTVGDNLCFGLDALEHDPTVPRGLPATSLVEPDAPRSTAERVDEALTLAGLSDDVEAFTDGLETLVGERGITLSGGQKQRVTIARALLVDPRILVLDDALSSVDTRTEATILDHLETVMGHRTSIVVTHRFHALHRFDQIFVLEHGRLVEHGTHAELVQRGGIYAQMYARQQLAEAS